MSRYVTTNLGIWPFPPPKKTRQQIQADQTAAKKAEEAAKKAQVLAVAKATDAARKQAISNQIISPRRGDVNTGRTGFNTQGQQASVDADYAFEEKTPWALYAGGSVAALLVVGLGLKMLKKKR